MNGKITITYLARRVPLEVRYYLQVSNAPISP